MVVPAHDKITFRVRGGADREINEYKTHKVRITSAKPISCNYSSKKKKSALLELFISWTPMLLLIAVWIFFMRKYQGKNSPQKRIIELQKRQCELIEKQNTLFEKLVDAVKMINKDNNKIIAAYEYIVPLSRDMRELAKIPWEKKGFLDSF